MPLTDYEAALLGRVYDSIVQCRASAPASPAPEPGVANRLDFLIQKVITMSDSIQQLTAAANEVKAKLDAAEVRDQSRSAAFSALKATIADQTAQLSALQAQLAALPTDTAAQETAIASVVATLNAASTEADGIAAEPAPAPVAEPVTDPAAVPVDTAAPVAPAPVADTPTATPAAE